MSSNHTVIDYDEATAFFVVRCNGELIEEFQTFAEAVAFVDTYDALSSDRGQAEGEA